MRSRVMFEEKNNFGKKFNVFCGKLHSLMIEKQLAIDIDITFMPCSNDDSNKNNNDKNNSDHDDNDYRHLSQIFSSHFDKEKVLKEYILPKCNQTASKHLIAKSTPSVSFVSRQDYRKEVVYDFCVSNVDYRPKQT